ncbi:MAG TPA: response regulator [Nitrososphaeraceae archaeon]|nr:response regulator [Nitrososphaeraceae archaeon]
MVDDEPDICETFKVVLQENGYNVKAFIDPIVALEHLLNNPSIYELVISDYRMPNLNGYELCTKVKELNRNINVILTSAYDIIEDNNNNKLNFELLRKPFTIQNLLDRVNACLYNNATSHHYQRGLDEI